MLITQLHWKAWFCHLFPQLLFLALTSQIHLWILKYLIFWHIRIRNRLLSSRGSEESCSCLFFYSCLFIHQNQTKEYWERSRKSFNWYKYPFLMPLWIKTMIRQKKKWGLGSFFSLLSHSLLSLEHFIPKLERVISHCLIYYEKCSISGSRNMPP